MEPEAPTTREQRAFELQQRYERDLPADARASAIGREVRAEIGLALAGNGELHGVECKLKTCRASLTFPTVEGGRALFQKVLSAGDGPFASFEMQADHQVASDGQMTTVLYFYL